MGRVGAFTVGLAFAACTAGPERHVGETATVGDPGAVEAPDALSIAAPESLLHLGESDLLDAMGEPAFVWVESGAQMWRYDADACALFVFLYPDGVRHVDLRSDGLDDTGRDACFRELAARRI